MYKCCTSQTFLFRRCCTSPALLNFRHKHNFFYSYIYIFFFFIKSYAKLHEGAYGCWMAFSQCARCFLLGNVLVSDDFFCVFFFVFFVSGFICLSGMKKKQKSPETPGCEKVKCEQNDAKSTT